MEIKKLGLIYTGVSLILALVMAYSIATISATIEFLTMFASLFIVLIIMKLIILFFVKTFIIEKIVSLKDEIKRFNFTKAEKKPPKYDNSCTITQLAKEIYEYQNKSLHLMQTLERQLEEKNDLLRENQYYIEHLESAILKSKTGEEDGV